MDSLADIEVSTSFSSSKVFCSAEAVVSDTFLSAISEDKLSFFNHICSIAQVNIICNTKGNFTAQGSWKKILALEKILTKTVKGRGSELKPSVANYFLSEGSSPQSQSEPKEYFGEEGKVLLKTVKTLGETKSDATDPCIDDTNLRSNLGEALTASHRRFYIEQGGSCKDSVASTEGGNEIYVNITLTTCNELSVKSGEPTSVTDIPAEDSANSSAKVSKLIRNKGDCGNAQQSSNTLVSEKDKRKIYEQQAPFKFFCNFCSFKSKRESHYKKHIQLHKQGNSKLYICSQCGFRTIRMGHLRRHELQHASEALSCTKCSYTTDNLFFLQRHHRIKHSAISKEQTSAVQEQLNCQHCSYKTTQSHFLKRHLRVHEVGEDANKRNLYQCEKCNYTTWRKEHFERHQRDVHSEVRPFLCDTCGKAFKRADALRQHRVSRHHPLLTSGQGIPAPDSASSAHPVHCCPHCSKPCRSRAHLKDHMAAHSDERSFLCEICGSSFKTRAVQRKHIATVHANPKAFPCNHCVRRFSTKYALLRHKKIHGLTNDESESPEGLSNHEARVLQYAGGCQKLEEVDSRVRYVSDTVDRRRLESCKEDIPDESERQENADKVEVEQPKSLLGTDGEAVPQSLDEKEKTESRGCAVVIGMDGEMQSVSGGILTRTPAPSETTTALLYLTTDFTHYR